MNIRVLAIALVMAALVLGGGWMLMRRAAEDRSTAAAPDAGETMTERSAAAAPPADPPPARREPLRGAAPAATEAPAAAAAPTRGILHIDSDVPGAQVFLDRTFAGNAPVTLRDVAPGSHRINVSAEGFEGVAQDIEVQPGPQSVTLSLREIRLNAAIPVVHKHRTGSCTGQLVGTPDGIRYDTPHAEDAFAVGLHDLEVFEVDYLEKNLRIKPRGGRQYNFTDAGGNADPLFVFHRDVDKVRSRVAP